MSGSSGSVVSPHMREGELEGDRRLVGEEATRYRALVARGIYLAQDRTDVGYAVKEMSRKMGTPWVSDMGKMKRFARYLIGRERVVVRWDYQKEWEGIDVSTDSDYAGCRVTRKSTSGGVGQLGYVTR